MMRTDPIRRPQKRSGPANAGSSRRKTGPAAGRPGSLARSALERQALQGFRTVFGSARIHDTEVRRSVGISGSQLWALSKIARSGGMTVNALAECMALHQTTASNLVNALAERKLIRRLRDDADQRVVHLHVSMEGKRLLLRAPGPYEGLLVDALRRLETDQLERLRKSLAVLLGVMRSTTTTAAGETLLGE
jgi:DNA-binding MarR family transcriptional regulator